MKTVLWLVNKSNESIPNLFAVANLMKTSLPKILLRYLPF